MTAGSRVWRGMRSEIPIPEPIRALSHRLRDARATAAIAILFGLGGLPALIYQVAWQRILALHSGVGAVSIATIVAAYMAGLGLGNLAGAHLSRRLSPKAALAFYAVLELAIGVFGFVSAPIYHDVLMRIGSWGSVGLARTAMFHGLALLPPTLLMGMTFPVLVRAMVRNPESASRTISLLYGLNVLGAAVGAILTPWVLIPRLGGLVPAIQVAAALNLLVGFGVLGTARWLGFTPMESISGDTNRQSKRKVHSSRIPFSFWILLYASSGAWALALEVVWFRMLDVATKGTAFTFGTLVAVYLGGLAIGSLLGTRRACSLRDPLARFLSCQCVILIYVGMTTLALTHMPSDFSERSWLHAYWGSYEPLDPLHAPTRDIIILYGILPLLLFGPPTVAMGLAFAALQAAVQDRNVNSGFKVGILQCANILGCVAGSVIVSFVLFPWIGTAGTIRALVGGGALFAVVGLVWTEQRGRFRVALVLLGTLTAILPDAPRFWSRLHGAEAGTLLLDEGETGVLALAREPDGRWRLSVNGKGQSLLPYGGIHSRLGALAAIIHRQPEAIALIGLGSGDTAWASSCRPETRVVRVFEICPRQPQLLRRLNARANLPHLDAFLCDPRIQIEAADGRHALAHGAARYDVIEADAIRPNGAYSGNLYSLEFYRLCASRLKPGGLMCSWAPTSRVALTFQHVFPHVLSLDGGQILIGSMEPIAVVPETWLARLDAPEVVKALGPDVVSECRASLTRARLITSTPPPDIPLNRDLAPLDEYRVR